MKTRLEKKINFQLLVTLALFTGNFLLAQTTVNFTTPGTTTWTVPNCVNSITVQVWAGGGGGGACWSRFNNTCSQPGCASAEVCVAGGGGGGGGFVTRTYAVIPGQTYTITVGSGGVGGTAGNSNNSAIAGSSGGNSTFSGPATVTPGVLTANGGAGGGAANFFNTDAINSMSIHQGANGAGGAGGGGLNFGTRFFGGNGATGAHSGSNPDRSGAGGGGAGTTAAGGNATSVNVGGTGGAVGGGNGANGGNISTYFGYQFVAGVNGFILAGGGSGGLVHNRIQNSGSGQTSHRFQPGGNGSRGEVRIIYTAPSPVTPTFSTINPICNGSPISPLPTTSTNGISGTWSPSLSNTATNTYTFTPAASECATTANLTVNVISAPVMTSASTASVCSGDALNLSLSSSVSSNYSWVAADNPNTNGESLTIQNGSVINNTITNNGTTSQSVVYSVTPTSVSGSCTGTAQSVTVTVNPLPDSPSITASGPLIFCSGGNVTLASSASSGNLWSNGSTNQTINVNASGTYSLSVNNASGCESPSVSASVVVNPLPGTPSISSGGPTTLCAGNTVTLTSSSATGNLWSNGSNSQSITVNASGTYSVTVTDANGCTSSAASNAVVVNPNPSTPTVSLSGPTTFCSGDSVILISSSVSGNLWNTGANTQSITVSNAGNYSVTVTDANGCSSSSAVTNVTVNASTPNPVISDNGLILCDGQSTVLTSSSNSGNTWNTGETTQSITVTNSGTYTLVNDDGSGCPSQPVSVTVTVNSNPATPVISLSGSANLCDGDSLTLTSSSLFGNVWSTGDTTQSIVVYNSGNYSLSVTDPNGCNSASVSSLITVNSNPTTPTLSLSGPSTFCSGDSVVLISSAVSGNVWSTGETTQTITVYSAGNYFVTVSDLNGCNSDSVAATITVTPGTATPTITDSGLTICAGQSTTLLSSSSAGNLWSTGETTQTITVSTSGTFSLVTDDGSGCPSLPVSVSVTVIPNPSVPIINALGPLTFCEGDSVLLSSSSTLGNLWSNGDTSQVIVVNSSGEYSLTVGISGCSSQSDTTFVVELPLPPTPNISTNGTVFCVGQSVTLSSNSTSGNTWSNGQTTSSITVTTSGDYWLTNTDTSGCTSDSATISLTFNPLPVVPLITVNSSTTICMGDSVELSVNPGTGIIWSPINSSDSIVTVSNSGNYTATLTDSNGCTSISAPLVVTVNPVPLPPTLSISGGNTNFCFGQSANLVASPGGGITWLPGGQITDSISVFNSGTFYASYTDTNGCTSVLDSIAVFFNPLPNISSSMLIDTAFCDSPVGGIHTVNVTGGTGGLSYQWLCNGLAVGTDSVLTNVGSGDYTLVVTDQMGCSDTSAVHTIPSAGGIQVNLNASSVSGFEPFATTLVATTDVTASSYSWFNNAASMQGSDSLANIVGLMEGTHTVSVIVTDRYGCEDTASIVLSVDAEINLVIPNVFSPNGDNTNDVFFITSKGFKELTLEIYDRWGLKLWNVYGLNPAWDGKTSDGDFASDGTYFYILTGLDLKDNRVDKAGTVFLVR